MFKKIDYKNKHGIMVGYIDRSENVVAVETGWKTTPEALTGVLMSQYNSKEMAKELVDSPTSVSYTHLTLPTICSV